LYTGLKTEEAGSFTKLHGVASHKTVIVKRITGPIFCVCRDECSDMMMMLLLYGDYEKS
jgi:hypothetical protein